MPKKAKDKIIEVSKNALLSESTSEPVVKDTTSVKKSVSKRRTSKVSEKKEVSKAIQTTKTAKAPKPAQTVQTLKDTSKKNSSKIKKTSSSKESPSRKNTSNKKLSTNSSVKKASKKETASHTKSSSKKIVEKDSYTPKTQTKKIDTPKVTEKKKSSKESTKKVASSKTSTAKSKKTSKTNTKKKKASFLSSLGEYYDLPNHYEQTLVKILAQTPTILFVYWDISNQDRQNLITNYGENFFQETCPYLQVKNQTKNYQFEVEINDYANSWYLHIPDSDCEYEVVLMRKNKNSQIISENNGHLTITSSNQLETPNDHILFEKLGKTIFFQDTKTHQVQEKNIASFHFIHNMGRIYNIYDLYKEIYQNELNGDELGTNLSSSNFSSNFK